MLMERTFHSTFHYVAQATRFFHSYIRRKDGIDQEAKVAPIPAALV